MAETRKQSPGEEFANSLSHGIAAVLVTAAVPILIVTAVKSGSAAAVVGAAVFSLTMLLLYLASSIYHGLPDNRAKRLFKIFDHSAIYLLIAGSYTPFTLVVLKGALGWALFGVVWTLALAGILLKSVGALRCDKLSVLLYVVMGWLVVIAIKPLWEGMSAWGFACLVAGGISYTAGVAFYAAHHVRYAHFVWHLLVMLGTASHVAAVMSVSM